MLDHVSIQCGNLAASAASYDAVLAMGGRWIFDRAEGIGCGVELPRFWSGPHRTEEGFRESHPAFRAPDRDAAVAFRDAEVAAGSAVLHEPRGQPEHHSGYFGMFVRDPDGNYVEAVLHSFEGARS